VPVKLENGEKTVNIPIDIVIMPKNAKRGKFPLFFEAKSAGDYTNTNKRRKEEAVKMAQLRSNYGSTVQFNLFLCGYFDSGYLGYEASEGIDWVWEHRIDDLALFGI
jgi:type II restriction enzyme